MASKHGQLRELASSQDDARQRRVKRPPCFLSPALCTGMQRRRTWIRLRNDLLPESIQKYLVFDVGNHG